MAYAEKAGRGWRCRWRDQDGALRSASGFTSREDARDYGRARETGLRFYRFTRPQLIEAVSRLTVGPGHGAFIAADSFADAIIKFLEDGSEEGSGND